MKSNLFIFAQYALRDRRIRLCVYRQCRALCAYESALYFLTVRHLSAAIRVLAFKNTREKKCGKCAPYEWNFFSFSLRNSIFNSEWTAKMSISNYLCISIKWNFRLLSIFSFKCMFLFWQNIRLPQNQVTCWSDYSIVMIKFNWFHLDYLLGKWSPLWK